MYTINRLPTPRLNNKTIFHVLFNIDSDYSLLRVFGCLCFPWLRPFTKDKLSRRSKSFVFLGYSKLPKGYKCFDLVSSKFYVSRHVIFDENIFPFVSQDVVVPPSITNAKSDPLNVTLPFQNFISPSSVPPMMP